jgi:hypothetical protein
MIVMEFAENVMGVLDVEREKQRRRDENMFFKGLD